MEVDLTIPQTEMFLLECKFPLFVGGYGSGKTQTLLVNALRDIFSFPETDVSVAIYCPTYDLLNLNFVPRLEVMLQLSGIKYKLNKQAGVFEIPGQGKIIMRSMSNPDRIIAFEVFRSHVDELDTIGKKKATDVWDKLMARNRQVIPKRDENGNVLFLDNGKIDAHKNTISSYTTPDHGFHSFTYERWGDKESEYDKEDYQYVQASTLSNPHLPGDYVETLRKNYPPTLVDAFIEGKWVNMAGAGIFDTSKFQRYDVLPNDIAYINIYCDTAQKTKEQNDYSVFQAWAYSPSQGIFLIDQMRGKWESPQLRQNLIDFWQKHANIDHRKPYALRNVKVEDKSSGTGLIQDIQQSTLMPIAGIPRFTDKVSRSLDGLPQIAVGNVHIPAQAPWIADYIAEFDQFTVEMTGHDDQIDPTLDAISDMLIELQLLYAGAVG